MDVARECQSIIVTDAYSEDVPYTTAQADAAMFRVGYTGAATVTENHLIVTGGNFQGRSAGTHGSFIDANYCEAILAGNFNVSRYVNVVKTDVTNTRANSIILGGYCGVGYTNNIRLQDFSLTALSTLAALTRTFMATLATSGK